MLITTGQHIIDHLKNQCLHAPANTFSTSDLVGVKARSQVHPARHVVLHSYAPRDEVDGDGLWDEIYLVVHVVRSARQVDAVADAAATASAMIAETLGVLAGWRPPETAGALRILPPPNPVHDDGFSYYAMAFSVSVVTGGFQD